MRNTFLLLLFVVFASFRLVAQAEPRFYAEANPLDVPVGEPITVSFIVENGNNLGKFTPPDWAAAGFVLLGSSQSSSITIMNGETNASASYNFNLAATDTGALVIPSVSIQNGKSELRTMPLTIRASPNLNPSYPKHSPTQPPAIEPKKKIKTIRM